ncbi:MAG: hypothetical protein ACUVSX_12475 [Aggregatilineales bacterium]
MRRITRAAALVGLALLLAAAPLRAEPESDLTTLDALAQAVIPPRDRLDLARRLLGVAEIPPRPASAAPRAHGERQTFWATNLYENRPFQVTAALRAVGEHIYLWVEDGVKLPPETLAELVEAFDTRIYHQARALWGSEDVPGIDGEPRVYALFAFGMGPSVAAYFASEHTNPAAAVPTSNQHEMFFFNLDALGTFFRADDVASVIAHEFQHMIREAQDSNEDAWLDEGFSMFTELHLGYLYSGVGLAHSFLAAPNTQLNTWPESDTTLPHYGASLLFVTYFYERFGLDALRQLSAHPANGLASVDAVLAELGGPSADTLFADWALANALQDASLADGRYGYSLLTLNSAPFAQVVSAYSFEQAVSGANQYATTYFLLTGLDGLTTLEIALADLPPAAPLFPAQAASGARVWYSNRADDSSTRLTRAFDLAGVDSAALEYSVWYHIEHLWDYGYVMVSADGGATWTPLATAYTTDANPHNNAYGPGYTGSSGGWLSERVPLDDYTGQEILVRFEMITDDAVNQAGMAIDDVRIAEIGYASDFEDDAGGWQAEGWVWVENALPQRAWVQLAQRADGELAVTRWLVPDDGTEWTVPLLAGADWALLAVSPFAPVTTVPTSYTLRVTGR